MRDIETELARQQLEPTADDLEVIYLFVVVDTDTHRERDIQSHTYMLTHTQTQTCAETELSLVSIQRPCVQKNYAVKIKRMQEMQSKLCK